MGSNLRVQIIALLALAFMSTGCSDVSFSTALSKGGGIFGLPPNPFDDPCVEGICEDNYAYNANPNPQLDLLFMVDTSGSLDQEREAVAEGLVDYVAALQQNSPNTDYNIAVALAHGPNSNWSGRLYRRGNEPIVLQSSIHDAGDIQNWLEDKLENVDGDGGTDGGEVGMYATQRLLEPGNLAIAQGQGFFRANAALAIVYIADENDICAIYPNGVTPVPDPNGLEGPTKANLCPGYNNVSTFQKLVDLKGINNVLVASVIYTGQNPVPQGGENEIGYGYTSMAINAGARGRLIDIAGNNIAAGMANFGDLSGNQANPNNFVLSHPNAAELAQGLSVDVSSIVVRVTRGGSVFFLSAANGDFTYVANGNYVLVEAALLGGDQIKITYSLQ